MEITLVREDDRNAVWRAAENIDSVSNIFGKINRQILSAEIEKLIKERQEAGENEILFVPTKFIYPSRDFHFMKLPISALIFSRLLS